MLFLIIYLNCSNLIFIAWIFKFPKTSLLEFLVFRVLRELERLYRMFSSLIKTLVYCVSLASTWFGFEADQFPEFTICELFSIKTFSSCQKNLLKWQGVGQEGKKICFAWIRKQNVVLVLGSEPLKVFSGAPGEAKLLINSQHLAWK